MFRELDLLFPKVTNSFFDINEITYNMGSTEYYDAGDHFVYKFDLPGVLKEDVSVDTENNFIKVTWTRKPPDPKPKITSNKYGTYTYQVPIVALMDIENIKASMENGVLSVKIGKTARKKQILIT